VVKFEPGAVGKSERSVATERDRHRTGDEVSRDRPVTLAAEVPRRALHRGVRPRKRASQPPRRLAEHGKHEPRSTLAAVVHRY